MSTLTYTQHSVAWPTLTLSDDWHTDEVLVSLAADGGGTDGEMKWTFMDFGRGSRGVQMSVFGDGLPCLFDSRIQAAIALWRYGPNPDDMTPAELTRILDDCGAVPSEYHLSGSKQYLSGKS